MKVTNQYIDLFSGLPTVPHTYREYWLSVKQFGSVSIGVRGKLKTDGISNGEYKGTCAGLGLFSF